VYVDEALIAETTTLQHCGLIITYCLLEDLNKLVKQPENHTKWLENQEEKRQKQK